MHVFVKIIPLHKIGGVGNFRSSGPDVFCKKGVLRNETLV